MCIRDRLAAHHAAALVLGLLEELGHLLHVHAQHMVGQQVAGLSLIHI